MLYNEKMPRVRREERSGMKKTGEKKESAIWALFITFLKIGAFTFGGGYAMIPMIQKELVEKKRWLTEEDVLEIVAIAESTPGPIAVNSATFVGYRVGGFRGALCATIGVVLPAFCVISLISLALRQFQENKAVQYAFYGIRAGVLALIVRALCSLGRQARDGLAWALAGAAFLAAALGANVLLVILGSAAVGLGATLLSERGKRA